MYAQYFNFKEPPFSITPNPRYVYLSPQHSEALAHLLYGISIGGGFVALTGEVGTGKTTLCRCLLEQLPEDVDIAVIFNPRLNPRELVASICDELRIEHPQHRASLKRLIDLLNHYLLDAHARGRRTVVLIDEAQNLSFDVLEQIRLLTNLETNDSKLLQIILVGQPELNTLLKRKNLRQLSQRITARYHLRPLSLKETAAYIRHRIAVSGGTRRIFTAIAIAAIYRLSSGIPRLINLICDRALLGAYTLNRDDVDYLIVRKAAKEVLPMGSSARLATRLTGAAAILSLTLAAGWFLSEHKPQSFAGAASPSPAAGVSGKPGDSVSANGNPRRQDSDAKTQSALSEEPGPSFAKLIAQPQYTRTAALAQLFALWKIKGIPGVGDECVFAKQNGLRCLVQVGSWPALLRLNHPAVLELLMPDGNKRYATLSQINGNQVQLWLGDRTHEVTLAELLPLWQGDAVLLWKPPNHFTTSIKPGDMGESVQWLRVRLGMPAAAGTDGVFDARLKARVIAFQIEQGLAPDGVVGPQTMIHLVKKLKDPAVPRLSSTKD